MDSNFIFVIVQFWHLMMENMKKKKQSVLLVGLLDALMISTNVIRSIHLMCFRFYWFGIGIYIYSFQRHKHHFLPRDHFRCCHWCCFVCRQLFCFYFLLHCVYTRNENKSFRAKASLTIDWSQSVYVFVQIHCDRKVEVCCVRVSVCASQTW